MDILKYPIDKLSQFLVALIPGLFSLLTFDINSPYHLRWFINVTFLGYRTKIALILLVAFVVGYSMTTILAGFIGALGGAFGAYEASRSKESSYKPPHSFDVAPWRDSRWRAAVKIRLKELAPRDNLFLSQDMFDLKKQWVDLLPEEQRSGKLQELMAEKLDSDLSDLDWARWYDHFHFLTFQPGQQHPLENVRRDLNFSLEATGIYALLSAPFVASVRHWWILPLASFWLLVLIAEQYTLYRQYTDKWATLTTQIKWLSGS